ncbi:MAG: exonuclease SbcCD subunit D [Fusobacteriaceae bacterium]|jgi:exonuclease SbcD|nr:exonuclease SbcCD subunit D [Fusobacteriaceae bacterium]
MKFLHLADLHIGKNVNGFSMIEEQKHIFKQIADFIKTQEPEAVIIAGDVYDRALPSIEAVRVFDDFLTELARLRMTVLVISGNHDSPERMDFASRLLAEQKLYICGAYTGAIQKVTLPDRYGNVHFWLLPFIKPYSVRSFFKDMDLESYDEALAAALRRESVDFGERNVLVSHQFYGKTGVLSLRSDSEISSVGGLDEVDSSHVEKFDYVALGHLHGAQSVGNPKIRYAGSPLKYSFSEIGQKKSITLVELREKGDLSITEQPLTPLRDMREIRGSLADLTSGKATEVTPRDDYYRVILSDADDVVDPMGKLRMVFPNIMGLAFENRRAEANLEEIRVDMDRMKRLSLYDLFSEFFEEIQGIPLSPAQTGIVRELLEREGEQ